MKLLRSVRAYTRLDKIPNERIEEKLNSFRVNKRKEQQKQNWRDHTNRTEGKKNKVKSLKRKLVGEKE